MEDKKNHIVLLDEHLYGNCWQYCKMSALAALRIDSRFIMANDVFYYDFNTDLEFSVRPTIKQKILDDDLFPMIGVKQERIICEDILPVICKAIDENKYAMVCVDCFYYPPYAKCYHIKHKYHYFLIYGYDKSHGIFYTIEPWGFIMGTPLLQPIKFDELVENVEKAKSSFALDNYVTLFSRENVTATVNVLSFFKALYSEYFEWLLQNYKLVETKIEMLFKNSVRKDGANLTKYHGYLDRFCRHKQSQAFVYKQLLDNDFINAAFSNLIVDYYRCLHYTDQIISEVENIDKKDFSLTLQDYAEHVSHILHENISSEIAVLIRIEKELRKMI